MALTLSEDDFVEIASRVTNVLNTACPASPTANSIFDFLRIIDGVTGGVATPSGGTVAFKDRFGATCLTITYGDDEGERTASALS